MGSIGLVAWSLAASTPAGAASSAEGGAPAEESAPIEEGSPAENAAPELPSDACPQPATVPDLGEVLDEAERHLLILDAAEFEAAVDRARALVGCITQPIPPDVSARLHRAVGLRAFAARDPLAAVAFAAARRIDPRYELPKSLFPPESPVAEVYGSFDLSDLQTVTLFPPPDGWITLDGRPDLLLAPALPVVYQRFAEDGRVVSSAYADPGAPLPEMFPAPPDPVPERPIHSGKHRLPLAIAAGGAGLVGLGTWGLSVHGRSRYLDLDEPVPDDRLDGLRLRTNALAVTSITTLVAATGAGITLAVTW